MRKRLFYMLLQIKSAFKFIPGLFAGTLLFAFIAFCIGMAGVKYINSGTGLFFKIAVVLPADDKLVSLGFSMLTQMDSLDDYCEFIQTDDESAKKMLRDGEVYGIVYIPEGFVEDVLNGRNTPAVVILPDNPGIETVVFRSVLNAGSDTLAYVQSGIYAMSDAYMQFGLSDRLSESSDELNDYYLRFVFNHSNIFNIRKVSPTGTLSGVQFYICSGITAIILFLGFLLGSFITSENRETSIMLKRSGISHFYACICKCLAMSLACTCIIAAMLFIIKPILRSLTVPDDIIYSLSLRNLLCLFFGIFIAVSYFFTVYTAAGSGLYGMLLLFCLNVVMLYCSGIIIPASYLPKLAAVAGKFLPSAYIKTLLDTIYTDTLSGITITAGAAYSVVFLLISAFIRERNCHEA